MGVKERREREKSELRQAILAAGREIVEREGWEAVTIRHVAEKVEYSPPVIYEHFASKEHLLFDLVRGVFRQLLAEMTAARDGAADPDEAFVEMGVAYWRFATAHPELDRGVTGHGGIDMAELCHVAMAARGASAPPNAAGTNAGAARGESARTGAAPEDGAAVERAARQAMALEHRAEQARLFRSRDILEGDPFPEGTLIFLACRDALERALVPAGRLQDGDHGTLEALSWKVAVLWSFVHGLTSLSQDGLVPADLDRGVALIRGTTRALLAAWHREGRGTGRGE